MPNNEANSKPQMEQGSKPRARTDAHFDFSDLENRMIAFFGFSNLRFAWELGIGIWSLRLNK
jgi:hypothetical protein